MPNTIAVPTQIIKNPCNQGGAINNEIKRGTPKIIAMNTASAIKAIPSICLFVII